MYETLRLVTVVLAVIRVLVDVDNGAKAWTGDSVLVNDNVSTNAQAIADKDDSLK